MMNTFDNLASASSSFDEFVKIVVVPKSACNA